MNGNTTEKEPTSIEGMIIGTAIEKFEQIGAAFVQLAEDRVTGTISIIVCVLLIVIMLLTGYLGPV